MGVNSFETLLDADPRKIEIVTGRKYPFGNHIKESLLSLPPKVELRFEENEQGKSKLGVMLTRLSQSTASTKRHYADMMISTEEGNIILFHEKIRLDDFLSPYCPTVHLPSPQHGKLTVNADLLFEEFIGIDIHQTVTVGKDIGLHAKPKQESKYPSYSRPKNKSTAKGGDECNDGLYKSPPRKPSHSNISIGRQDNLPSFKLLDEDSEEDLSLPHLHQEPAVETEYDDCKMITERTVFDHLREKARNLPALALSSDHKSAPSQETLTLIRKRTRERHLESEDPIDIPEENSRNKLPRNDAVTTPFAETDHLEAFFDNNPTQRTVGSSTGPPVHESFYWRDYI